MWNLDIGIPNDRIDYRRIAVDAGNCYRAMSLVVEELETISPENPQGIKVFERFLSLHREFYDHVIALTSEESWIVDEDFKNEVQEEVDKLNAVVQYLKKEKWLLDALTGKVIWRSNQMADYFARCVADIFDWYGVDEKTNEIFFVMD